MHAPDTTAAPGQSPAPQQVSGRREWDRAGRWLALAALAVPLVAVAGILIGSVSIAPAEALQVLWLHLSGTPIPAHLAVTDTIITVTRIPRVLTGLAAGAVLAVAGAALQAMVRNPLADPYVLGISSGASVGAAAAIALGIGGVLGAFALPAAAFVGAIAATVLVLALAGRGSQATSLRLVLVGIAVGYGFAALTNLIIFLSATPEATRSVMFWMLGSLATATWSKAALVALAAALLAVAVLPRHRSLDALAAGDRTALGIGVDPRRTPHPAHGRGVLGDRPDRCRDRRDRFRRPGRAASGPRHGRGAPPSAAADHRAARRLSAGAGRPRRPHRLLADGTSHRGAHRPARRPMIVYIVRSSRHGGTA